MNGGKKARTRAFLRGCSFLEFVSDGFDPPYLSLLSVVQSAADAASPLRGTAEAPTGAFRGRCPFSGMDER